MKTASYFPIRRITVTALLLITVSLFNTYSQAQKRFEVFAVSDLHQIFEDGYRLPARQDTLKLFGIRNEIISGQFVIEAEDALENLSVEISQLMNSMTGKSMPASNVAWNFVGSIPLVENAPNQFDDILVRKAPARFPDYLMEERQLDVGKASYQAVWLTITLPKEADPGKYSASMTINEKSGKSSLPVELRVYPFTLPDKRNLKVTEWYTTRHFERLHGIKERYSREWFDMLRIYAENLAEHRQNIFQVPMNVIEITRLENGTFEFDFTRFDQIAQVFWDTGKMDFLETGELARFGDEAWFSTDIGFKDFEVKDQKNGQQVTLEGMEVIPHLLTAFENHLRGKGWLDKTLFHVKDEPTLRNITAWKEISSIIHKYAPDLVRIDALETTHLFDDIEIAVPKLDYLDAWLETYRNAAEKGTELWYYTVGIYQARYYPNKTIDMPLIDNRILHWINYKYDLTGFLHWGWNHWTEDPFQEVGMHIGDAWHVYPSKNGVLNSLRWEQMRNGIQDYEYFRLLEDKVRNLRDSLGSHFSWIDPGQRGKEIAGTVVKNLLEHSDDPENLYAAKKKVLKELSEFNSSPRVYIQTNPPVHHSVVKERSYLVEIFGWAEKGTTVMIEGEEVPLDERGLFLWNVNLTQEENKVIVEVRKGQAEKTIVRTFDVAR